MAASTHHPDTYRDASSGTQILVGEMLAWSDEERVGAPIAVGELVRGLVAQRQPRRVLLAGPRAALLVRAIPDDVPLDILLRALPDARSTADSASLHDASRLHCGGLDAFEPDHTFDLVVALGGPTRLLGPDSQGLGEAETLRRLADLVSEDGILVADVVNGLGVGELLAAAPVQPDESDDLWHVGASGFDDRPLYAAELDAALGSAGLTALTTYAAYAGPDHHNVLVDEPAAVALGVVEQVRTHACLAVARATWLLPSLRDPRRTVERIADAGLLTALAPVWLVVSSKGSGVTVDLPVLVEAEAGFALRWSRVVTIDHGGASTSAWADGHDGAEVSEGRLYRDLSPTSSFSGRLLQIQLEAACASGSHARIRALVQAYWSWLHTNAVWTTETADRRAFAVPSNVTVDVDGALSTFDPSWRRTGIVSGDDAFVLGLRHFARHLLASAGAHPWRTDITPDELSTSLAAMAGAVVTESGIHRVGKVEAEIVALRTDRVEELDAVIEQNLEQGRFAHDLPSATAAGYRELLLQHRTQSRRLREHDGQVAWLEGTLRMRDRYVRELERIIERYEETLTYKTVQAIRTPRRVATEKAVGAAKSTVQQALPPDFMARARRAARRALK